MGLVRVLCGVVLYGRRAGDLCRLQDAVVFARIVQLLLEREAPTSTHEDSEEEIEGLRVLDRVCRRQPRVWLLDQ